MVMFGRRPVHDVHVNQVSASFFGRRDGHSQRREVGRRMDGAMRTCFPFNGDLQRN